MSNPDPVKIPFGYKRVDGQSQKGDGVWCPYSKKFVKVKKEYPHSMPNGRLIIRRCTVEQTELPGVSGNYDWTYGR